MIDAVLSYHTNPYTCGVAKFNAQLAEKLGVPFLQLAATHRRHPLLSVKFAELLDNGASGIHTPWPAFDLFAHDVPPRGVEAFDRIVRRAQTVYAADPVIAADLRALYGRSVEDAHCPGLSEGNPSRGTIDVLTFGMSHKRQWSSFLRLKHLLDGCGYAYTLSVSTGVHEGNPWDVAMDDSVRRLREIYGSHLRVLGFLADDALARILAQVTHVALFYDPAVRANNTTIWTALQSGVPTITNLDAHSPKELQHHTSVYDLAQLIEFPTEAARHRVVRMGGKHAAHAYSWDALLSKLQVPA